MKSTHRLVTGMLAAAFVLVGGCASSVDDPASDSPGNMDESSAETSSRELWSRESLVKGACYTTHCDSSPGGMGTNLCRRICAEKTAWCIDGQCWMP